MRILADENFPLESVQILRARGHDVIAVAEVASGAADVLVLKQAAEELHRGGRAGPTAAAAKTLTRRVSKNLTDLPVS